MSHEYGWTTEYIWGLTLREVDWRLRAIIDRNNIERKFQATMHKMEIRTPTVAKQEKMSLSKDQLAALEQAQQRIKVRNGR